MKVIDKFVKLYEIEKLRYKKKGIVNIAMAVFLLICIMKGASTICQLIWPTNVYHKQLFVVGISFSIHLIVEGLYFLIYLPGYSNSVAWYEKYRINKGVRRAWENTKQWPAARRKLVYYLAINYLIVYPGMIILSTKISGIRVRFQNLPTTFQLCWQLLFVAFVEDAGFYWAHRLAHQTKFLYKFHKIHHQYTNVFSLVTEYFHPIDYVLGNLIPSAIPFILLGNRVHCFMFFFWQVWKLFVSTEGHCGYYFPWSPTRIFFFVSDPSFHDYHHSKNIGTYCGSIYLWDYFNGSAYSYFTQYGIDFQKKLKNQ